MGDYRPLPIGVNSFTDMREGGYYYVDKTLFIKELLDMKGKVTLFTRPRRFGKTLNMTMLRDFFQMPVDEMAAEKQRALFAGLKIVEAEETYMSQMGQYPVIFLSLKSTAGDNWEEAFAALCNEIEIEFRRHRSALCTAELEEDREQALRIAGGDREAQDYRQALRLLSRCLEQAHGKKAIILIDEYDVPLEKAHFKGYYDKMIGFLRSLFESALKTNESLAFAVLTGCLRISRESIFTGLNNLKIVSVTSTEFAEHFGFTPAEVETLLRYYGKEHHLETVRTWYDGYLFGNQEVYNPWSVLSYLSEALAGDEALPRPYWANTSSNSIVKTLVEKADMSAKAEMETLIAGGTIEKPIHEDITYADVETGQDNLWNFLFFTGYLRKVSERLDGTEIRMELRIPNREVQSIYSRTIVEWFGKKLAETDLSQLYEATLAGDVETMEGEISRVLLESVSYMDSQEAFYHGLLSGLYRGMPGYLVKSNRKSGEGRPDLVLEGPRYRDRAVILELKTAKRVQEMEESSEEAVRQIREKKYREGLHAEGYADVIAYGIAFYRKDCVVKVYES